MSTTRSAAASPIESAYARFLELEEREHLWDLRAGDVQYWQAARIEAFDQVSSALGLLGRRQQRVPYRYLASVLDQPRYAGRTLRRYAPSRIRPADVLVVNHPRHMPLGDAWVCPYTTPLLARSGRSFLVLERSHKGWHFHPDGLDSVAYLDLPAAAANLEWLVRDAAARTVALRRGASTDLRLGIEALERGLGVTLERASLLRVVEREVRHMDAYARMYERILDRVRPRVVVEVVHYSGRCMPLTRVARERGVPVVEVQHGTIHPAHPAYNFAPGRRPPFFPDHLLLFGRYWRGAMPGTPLPEERTPAIGFAYLERQVERRRAEDAPRAKRLLVVSQSSIGEALSRLVVAAAPALDALGWSITYKLHPGEVAGWRERMPWLAASSIRVLDAPMSIYDAFAGHVAQLGVYSTALFEGLAFGLRSYVVRLPGWEAARGLVDAGVAIAVDDTAELVERLRDTIATSSEEVARAAGEVFASDARRSFWSYLDGLVAPPGTRQGAAGGGTYGRK